MSSTVADSYGWRSRREMFQLLRDRAARYFGMATVPAWKRFQRIAGHLSSEVVTVEDQGVLVEVIAACAQVRANLDGVEAEALQRLQHLRPDSDITEELAARLAITTTAAQRMMDRAAALQDYIEVHFALLGGEIDLAKTKVFIEATATLPEAQARAIHRAILPDAPGLTCGQLRHRLRTAVLAVDADMAMKRHQRAVADRYVRAEPADDGMAYLTFYLPAVDAAAAMATLDALAVKTGPEDDRPVAARRVDAFIAIMNQIMAQGRTPDGSPVPTQQGKRPHLVFTIAQSTLDGEDDAPGYLAGHGPLPADLIRHLANSPGPGTGDRKEGADAHSSNAKATDAPGDRNSKAETTGSAEDDDESVPYRTTTRVVRTDAHTGTVAEPLPGPAAHPDNTGAGGDDGQSASTGGPRDADPGAVEPAATEHVEPATTGNSVAAAGAGLPGGPPALSAGTGAADADPVKALARLGILATDAYQPGAALREHIITRDVTCRFPTCRQPARRCQIDHITPFDPAKPAWAQTHQGNLHLLCARHHQLKTTGTWHVRRDYPTGDTQWTSPLGYHHTRPAEIIDPTHHLDALHTALAAMRQEHADNEAIWRSVAPIAPGVIDEEQWARHTCTDPSHAPPSACTCAEQAEDITAILRRLLPEAPTPGGSRGSGTAAGFPSTTDPPPF